MARLGIVIAVAEYQGTIGNLPACRRDGSAFADVLRHTGRFDEILHLSGSNETVSAHVKTQLSALADRSRGVPVEEVVFYFSGHGDFDGEEFRYVLADYNARRPNQTSLSNSELDGIFRSLNPSLFVKVVDACHSGISYVKSEGDFTTYLKSSNTSFTNVYFMFSSQANEASYAAEHLSDFTRSLLSGVVQAPDGPVRYRDLMSAASDDFAASGSGQTPQFVIQANNTEIFCEVSSGLRDILRPYLQEENTGELPPPKASTLVERIRAEEDSYCTKEEADEVLRTLADKVNSPALLPELQGLFDIQARTESDVAPSATAIGSWLSDNSEKGLFAKPTWKSETYTERVPKNVSSMIVSLRDYWNTDYDDDNRYKTVTKTRWAVETYKITAQQEYGHIIIDLQPKLRAIAPARCYLAPVISRRDIAIFWRYVAFDYSDWETTVPKVSSKWGRAEGQLRDGARLQAIVDEIFDGFQTFVLNPLLERWPSPPSAPDTQNGNSEQSSAEVKDAKEDKKKK